MASESGGGGGSAHKQNNRTYTERVQSIGDNRDNGFGVGNEFHTIDSAKEWNRAYARAYGQYDPLRAAGHGPSEDGYGEEGNPDPLRNRQGMDGGLADGRLPELPRVEGYQQYGRELENKRGQQAAAADREARKNRLRFDTENFDKLDEDDLTELAAYALARRILSSWTGAPSARPSGASYGTSTSADGDRTAGVRKAQAQNAQRAEHDRLTSDAIAGRGTNRTSEEELAELRAAWDAAHPGETPAGWLQKQQPAPASQPAKPSGRDKRHGAQA